MLARFFQKSKPIGFISLLFLLFFYIIFYRYQSPDATGSLLFIIKSIGVFLFYAGILLLVDFIIYKNHLTATTYYALFVFVILIGLFPDVLSFSKISISNFFLLIAIRRLYSLQTRKDIILKLFDSGLYMGVAFLLYPTSLVFILLIYSSYFIYINIYNKNLLVPIIGLITPIFLTFTYFFISDDVAQFKTLTEINIHFAFDKFKHPEIFIPLVIILGLSLMALIKNMSVRQNLDNQRKKGFLLVFLNLIIALFVILINNLELENSIVFLFYPIAVLLGNFLYYTRKSWVQELWFYFLLLLSLQHFFWRP